MTKALDTVPSTILLILVRLAVTKGVIYDKCPVCQSENIMRMRRITGYLTGDLSTWNSAKRAEERDRVKHG